MTSLLLQTSLPAETVAVRQAEGVVHGFLLLRGLDGTTVASGDLSQSIRSGAITSRLIYRFKDGSLHDETAVYSQNRTFRLLTYRLIQKGPAFKRSMEVSLNASKGEVNVRSTDDDGKVKVINERMKLPADLANGFVPTLLKNVPPGSSTKLSMVVCTPKPRVVKLDISPNGEESFSAGGFSHKAVRYLVKIEIGGVTGVIAPLVGKQPPDSHVWILGGTAPSFVKAEGPLADGTPIWRIELTSPVWPKNARP
ncbi:MAG: hypothetical protein ABIZ80_19065 [Bryobacteraceae bacterium]